MQPTELTVRSSLHSLGEISDFVAASARAAGLDDHAVWEVQLATDEAVTNIILHAYGDHQLEGPVIVRTDLDDHEFVVSIRDQGAPFDPSAVPLPDVTSPLEDRTTGGLGLYLMRKLMDHVEFQFNPEGYNVVTMTKRPAMTHVRFVRLAGRIDASAVAAVQKSVRDAAHSGTSQIVVDLSDVTFISSSGLRILLLAQRELHARGGDLRLCAARPQVAEVFRLTGFDRVFELHPTREVAAESFPRA